LRCFGFSSRLLSLQAALHDALELRHELVRAQRSAGRFRAAQPSQCGLLRFDVDERSDAAKPLAQRRGADEPVIAPG
jgi:hypothetical protein